MRGYWCFAERVQRHACQLLFMVLEVVMLSWSPERSQQSGRSRTRLSLSKKKKGRGWVVGVCVNGWLSFFMMQRAGGKSEGGVSGGEEDMNG